MKDKLTAYTIAKKYVYGLHNALTDDQEVKDMVADINTLLTQQQNQPSKELNIFCKWLTETWSKEIHIPFGYEYAIDRYLEQQTTIKEEQPKEEVEQSEQLINFTKEVIDMYEKYDIGDEDIYRKAKEIIN